jgi:hypothetical protein
MKKQVRMDVHQPRNKRGAWQCYAFDVFTRSKFVMPRHLGDPVALNQHGIPFPCGIITRCPDAVREDNSYPGIYGGQEIISLAFSRLNRQYNGRPRDC